MDSIVSVLLKISFYTMLGAILIAFVRFLKGPTCADRVVALDTMTVIGISLIVMISVFGGRIIYLDVALVYALLSFLSGIVVARYMERGL
ncbi:MAG: monovalent cation/H+ antiporter complex subunit F [Candidatus Cloacimonadaceae bacterium]|nr:monovalent cation/H+ antiporter complex subunit F [Candidatus Cloacimonadaceae bacterium]MDP3114350.1 monovalent cation/H+ antiporter complex subunit F [Candidatus Cloacimonadaceae bacterium]